MSSLLDIKEEISTVKHINHVYIEICSDVFSESGELVGQRLGSAFPA